MTLAEKMKLIRSEIDDLCDSVDLFLKEAERQEGRKPAQGDGGKWDDWGRQVKDGLPSGATATGIERKVITIREQLTDVRKMVQRWPTS